MFESVWMTLQMAKHLACFLHVYFYNNKKLNKNFDNH